MSARAGFPDEAPAAGEDTASEKLRADLVKALRRACPSWLDSRRDDLVQIAMLKVLDVRKREENRALSPSYLYKTAYTVVVDEMRRAQWKRETSLENGGP